MPRTIYEKSYKTKVAFLRFLFVIRLSIPSDDIIEKDWSILPQMVQKGVHRVNFDGRQC